MSEYLDYKDIESTNSLTENIDNQPDKILTRQVISTTQKFTEEFCRDIYSNGDRYASSVENYLSDVVENITTDIDEVYFNQLYELSVTTFLKRLIHFIEENLQDPTSSDQVSEFIRDVYEREFSFTPNILNQIGMENLLSVTAYANRIPEVQGWLGQGMVGEYVYELRFCDENELDSIISHIEALPIEDILDIIHQFQTIAAHAIAQGAWARLAYERVVVILEEIRARINSPLVHYAVMSTLNRVQEEYQDPSLGVVTFHGNQAGGRLDESLETSLFEQSHALSHQLVFDQPLHRGDKLVKVASDSVMILDHSNFPRSIAHVEFGALPHEQNITQHELDAVEQILSKNDSQNIHQFARSILTIARGLDYEQKQILEVYAQKMSEKILSVSSAEWKMYFEAIERMDEISHNIEDERLKIRTNTEQICIIASSQFVEEVEELGQHLEAHLVGHEQNVISRDIEELRIYKDSDPERTFESAENIASHGYLLKEMYPSKFSEDAKKIVDEIHQSLKRVQSAHGAAWKDARDKEYTSISILENIREYKKHTQFLDSFHENPELKENLLTIIADLRKKYQKTLYHAHAESYKDILKSNVKFLNPAMVDKDIPLLLQHLHRPQINHHIEKDLGISLEHLSLEHQVYFLVFISEKNANEFEKLRTIMSLMDEGKEEFLKAFLATRYSEDYGDTILNIGEKLPQEQSKKIFEAYNNLNTTAQAIGKLADEYHVSQEIGLHDTQSLGNQLADAVMRRGKDVLNVAEAFALGNSTETSFYTKKLVHVTNLQEVETSLKIYTESLNKILSLINENLENRYSPEFIKSELEGIPETYHFKIIDVHNKEESYLSIQLRDYGVKYGEHTTKEFDGEARINFLFSPEPIKTDIVEETRKNALSIRLDREGNTRQNGEIIERDPTRQDGEVSLDVGSIFNEDENLPSSILGRVITVGNALDSKKSNKNTDPQYLHNRESFLKELGDADIFAKLVHLIQEKLQKRVTQDASPQMEVSDRTAA